MATSVNNYLRSDDQDESVVSKFAISDFKSFFILLKFAKNSWISFIVALGLLLTYSTLAIVSAKYMGDFVESGLIPKDYKHALVLAWIIISLEVVGLISQWIGRRLIATASSHTIYRIREELFKKVQLLPMGYYDRQPQGRIVTRLTHDVEGIEDFFTGSLGRLVNAFFIACVAIYAMCTSHLFLGMVIIFSMAPAVIFILATRKKVRSLNRAMSKLSSAVNSMLSEYLNGIDVIRSLALEQWSKRNFDGAIDEQLSTHMVTNKYYSWTRPLISFMVALPMIGLVWFGGSFVLKGTMTVGLFVTFVRYCERFFNPILILAREIHVIQQAFTSCERVANFLFEDDENTIFGENGTVRPDHVKGGIRFDNVSMAYDKEKWVLKDVSFEINAGERIGLVGRTGCGKTTTVSLLSRLYDFQKGDIFIDDHSVKDFDRNYLRSKIGFVSQDVVIFKATLRDNLDNTGRKSDKELLKACDATGLSKVMEKSGLTLESPILEGGSNLSVGERQLVSLTRVLITNPSILILDEATANIDPYFEKIIHEAVHNIMQDRTCLLIAHRLGTLKECDRIFIFDSGELKGEMSAEEFFSNHSNVRNYFPEKVD